MIRELGGLRTPVDTLDAPLARVYEIDVLEDGEVDAMRPPLSRERRFPVGGGRQSTHVSDLGFEAQEVTTSFYFQTAKLIYAAMGACLTTGTTTGVTGTISGGAGTAVIATGEAMTVDENAGNYLEITTGVLTGYKYHIISNDVGGNCTVDITTPAVGIDGEDFEIFGPPFTHDIRVGETIPSYGVHIEFPNRVPAETVILDLLGVLVKKCEISFEIDGDGMLAADLHVPKSVEGTTIANKPSDIAQCALFKWGQIDIFQVKLDADVVVSGDRVDQTSITIDNDASVDKTMGDFYATYKAIGNVDHGLSIHYFPGGEFARTLYDLKNTRTCDYPGVLSAIIEVRQVNFAILDPGPPVVYWDRYVKFTFTKLYVDEHPWSIPSPDDWILGVDAVFKLASDGELLIEAQDEFGLGHYEGSGEPTSYS